MRQRHMVVQREQERPYQHDSTASRLLSEVKHVRAWLVLRWGTTLESQVLFFCCCLQQPYVSSYPLLSFLHPKQILHFCFVSNTILFMHCTTTSLPNTIRYTNSQRKLPLPLLHIYKHLCASLVECSPHFCHTCLCVICCCQFLLCSFVTLQVSLVFIDATKYYSAWRISTVDCACLFLVLIWSVACCSEGSDKMRCGCQVQLNAIELVVAGSKR